MSLAPLPEEILDRFRSSSRDRLFQVKSAWRAATLGHASDKMLLEMHRNVHTLKGDARMVQFKDIDLVCQKLEDLFAASEELQYRVSSDLDLSVAMALDFIGLLLRRRGDQEFTGIDLNGFVAQVHLAVHRQSRAKPLGRAFSPTELESDAPAPEVRPPLQISDRLATSATKVFLEYISAGGAARTRLRGVWRDLQQEIAQMDSVAVVPLIERHAVAAAALAADMGQRVVVDKDLQPNVRVSAAVAQALDVALLHSVRNALSHGISGLGAREGLISIATTATSKSMQLTIRDNGSGINVEDIRARAISDGVMHPDVASRASRQDLLELLFQSRFTTRENVDEVAGRGIGLDVVRDAIQNAGGTVSIDGMPDEGAVLTIRMPLVLHELEIHMFEAYGRRHVLAVPAEWAVDTKEMSSAESPLDPLHSLGVRRPPDVTGLTQSGPPHILRFSRAETSVDLVAGKPSRPALARRICPTLDTFPVEIVTVEGAEVMLVRPDMLPTSTGVSGEGLE